MSRTRARSTNGDTALETNIEEASLWTSTLNNLRSIFDTAQQLDALKKHGDELQQKLTHLSKSSKNEGAPGIDDNNDDHSCAQETSNPIEEATIELDKKCPNKHKLDSGVVMAGPDSISDSGDRPDKTGDDSTTQQLLLQIFRNRREAAEKHHLTIESAIESLGILTALRYATEDSAAASTTPASAAEMIESPTDSAKRKRNEPDTSPESAAMQAKIKKAKTQLSNAEIIAQLQVHAQVAFRVPKKVGEESDWIQCTIVRIIGEGSKARYEIKDPEPSDSQSHSETYKTTAMNLVPLPKSRENLPIIASESKVLARYPETTTFYPATLKSMRRHGTCKLVFDGDDGRETEVDRLLVFEPPS